MIPDLLVNAITGITLDFESPSLRILGTVFSANAGSLFGAI